MSISQPPSFHDDLSQERKGKARSASSRRQPRMWGKAIRSLNSMEFEQWTLAKVRWFREPELAKQIRSLHSLVTNSIRKGQGHTIVVGTGTGTGSGSTQLFQARPHCITTQPKELEHESKELAHRRWKDPIGYIQPRLMNLNYNNFIRLNNQNTKESCLKVSEKLLWIDEEDAEEPALLYFVWN